MAKKLIDILSDAAVVRDETNEKANTAERVGGVLVELANYLSHFSPVSDVTVEADGDSVRLVLHLKNEDGTVSTRGVTLPGATTANAGVLTPELLKALNAADRANEDLAQEGISKAESASAMLFAEEAARKEADLSLNDLIEAEVTERLQSVATETAARTQRDAELTAVLTAETNTRFTADRDEKEARKTADDELSERITSEAASREAADAELQARIAILIPSAMTVEAPKRITWGNVFPVSIKAVLSPVTAMRNLIYISDNKAVEVSTDGVLTPVAKGVSRVHVIPTLNTAIARTCVIEVGDPRLRLSSLSALRFTQAGGFRLT